jgi:transcriptional regulator with XRE-family HTH domain
VNEFGLALRRWRRLRGIKQSHAAELLRVDQSTVSRWERGAQHPTPAEAAALRRLLQASLDAAGDAALRRLVESSALSVHLVCDLSHRLLAASPPRIREWGCGDLSLRGVSLWPFATEAIRVAEGRLADLGWYEAATSALALSTGANDSCLVHIVAGTLLWERIQLSDGTFARLVTTPPVAGVDGRPHPSHWRWAN